MFQNVTLLALGIDPEIVGTDAAYKAVRVGWQPSGQPSWEFEEDVAFVRCIEEDDEYNRIRDVEDILIDDVQINQVVSYTRVWRTFWTLWGPNCFDNARKIKSALLRPTQDIHDLMVSSSLYLVTDVPAPVRVPEPFQSRWWERCDFSAQFNEGVTEDNPTNTITDAEVLLYTESSPDIDHPVRDIVVDTNLGYGLGLYGVGTFDEVESNA